MVRLFHLLRKENQVLFIIEGVDRGGGGTGVRWAESGVEGAESWGVGGEIVGGGAGSRCRGGGERV